MTDCITVTHVCRLRFSHHVHLLHLPHTRTQLRRRPPPFVRTVSRSVPPLPLVYLPTLPLHGRYHTFGTAYRGYLVLDWIHGFFAFLYTQFHHFYASRVAVCCTLHVPRFPRYVRTRHLHRLLRLPRSYTRFSLPGSFHTSYYLPHAALPAGFTAWLPTQVVTHPTARRSVPLRSHTTHAFTGSHHIFASRLPFTTVDFTHYTPRPSCYCTDHAPRTTSVDDVTLPLPHDVVRLRHYIRLTYSVTTEFLRCTYRFSRRIVTIPMLSHYICCRPMLTPIRW